MCVFVCTRNSVVLWYFISFQRPPGSNYLHHQHSLARSQFPDGCERLPPFVDKTENTICALSTCLILMANGHASHPVGPHRLAKFLPISVCRRAYVCSSFGVFFFRVWYFISSFFRIHKFTLSQNTNTHAHTERESRSI